MLSDRLTAREVLDALDEWFVTAPPEETKKMWNILSALRGPDHNQVEFGTTAGLKFKNLYTIPIRRAAFPRLRDLKDGKKDVSQQPLGIMIGPLQVADFSIDTHWRDKELSPTSTPGAHFILHAQVANHDLGIAVAPK